MTYLILFCALLATAVGQSVFLTVLPSLGREAGLSELDVAILMSSSALVFAIGANSWSRVSGRVGFRRLLLLGLSGYTAGTFVFASIGWAGLSGAITGSALLMALLVARALQSTIMSATPPAAVGYVVAISTPATRAAAISKVTSANNLGQVLGPPLAGVLVVFGLLVPLYSVLVLTLLAIALVAWKLPPPPATSTAVSAPSAVTPGPARAQVRLLVAGCVSLFVCMALMQQSLSFFLMDVGGHDTVTAAQLTGTAMMISAAGALLVQFGVVQRQLLSATALIRIALPLLALAYAVMASQQQLLHLYVAMGLLGLGMGAAYPSLAAVATMRCAPARQSRVTGMLTASPAMGYTMGPPASAWLYGIDERLPFWLAASLMLMMAILLWLSFWRARHPAE